MALGSWEPVVLRNRLRLGLLAAFVLQPPFARSGMHAAFGLHPIQHVGIGPLRWPEAQLVNHQTESDVCRAQLLLIRCACACMCLNVQSTQPNMTEVERMPHAHHGRASTCCDY